MARVVWIATGVTWAFRSMLELLAPRYFDATTALDHLSIWAYSAALLLTAPTVITLSALSSTRSVRAVAIVTAAGAGVAGVANVAEDALRVPGTGYAYIAGFLVMVAGLMTNTAVLAVLRHWRLAAVFALWCIGVLLFTVAAGGLLILAVLVAVALRPGWFKTPGHGRHPQVH